MKEHGLRSKAINVEDEGARRILKSKGKMKEQGEE